jgi:hypothetical protein
MSTVAAADSSPLSKDRMSITATDVNPMSKDSELKSLLRDVDSVKTVEEFNLWRNSFLDMYTQHLDTSGSEKAAACYTKFSKTSVGLRKVVKQLQDLIDKGDLSADRISVKAKMTISELNAKTGQLIKEIDKLLPSTEKEIQAFGFSKWHMGAILVKDGFKEYAVMMHSRALLKKLRVAALDDVADQQILDGIDYFGKKFDIFCGVMADLGLMDACEKATEVLHSEMLQEARQAEVATKTLQQEKLSASQHSTVIPEKKLLDTIPVAAFNKSPEKVDAEKVDASSPSEAVKSPKKVMSKKVDVASPSEAVKSPKKVKSKKVDVASPSEAVKIPKKVKSKKVDANSPSVAVKTPKKVKSKKVDANTPSRAGVKTPKKDKSKTPKKKTPKKVDADSPSEAVGYKGVEDDESSYETIEELVTVYSYETVENPDDSSYDTVDEIEAQSEYETDEEEVEWSEYETDSDSDQKKSWFGAFSRKKKPKDKAKNEPKEGPKPSIKNKKPSTVSSSSDKAEGSSPSKRSGGGQGKDGAPSTEQDEDDEEGSGSSGSGSADEESDNGSGSDSSAFVPAPIKMGKTKDWDEKDKAPYVPTERMKWKKSDYYHGAVKRPESPIKKKGTEPKPKTKQKPKEKKLRRVVRTKTIKTQRKLEKPPPKKIRIKKDKPPIKVRVRSEKQIVKKTRVKKDKTKPIPEKILVKMEKPPKPPAPPL